MNSSILLILFYLNNYRLCLNNSASSVIKYDRQFLVIACNDSRPIILTNVSVGILDLYFFSVSLISKIITQGRVFQVMTRTTSVNDDPKP